MNVLRKVVNIITGMFTYFGLAALVAGGMMMALGIRTFITMSGSMEPKIKTGSVCLVNTRASFFDVEAGDIIVFETPSGTLVTHRVIRIEENGLVLVTKGDNNDVEDGPTTTVENFRGETLCSISYVGYVLAVFQQPQYKMMSGIVIVALILFIVIDCFYKDTI